MSAVVPGPEKPRKLPKQIRRMHPAFGGRLVAYERAEALQVRRKIRAMYPSRKEQRDVD
jgi:hypothetical protein